MKIVSVIGARPEFVQAAVLSRALRERHDEILVHTGQHYDDLMSDVFFRELGLPAPDVNLSVGSGPASWQVGVLLEGLARVFREHDPDLVMVRGDTNSTFAGALAARHEGIPIAHVEAGMRSFDLEMPEEVNRVLTDHISDLLFATGPEVPPLLAREGISSGVHVVGDVMYDTYLAFVERFEKQLSKSRASLPDCYDILTVHRAENTDDPARLRAIIEPFADARVPVIFPIHPRTRARLERFAISLPAAIQAVEPFGYLDMVAAERGARVIFTDSGGVQREAYWAGVPCVTLRDRTEWTNTVDAGWNRLVGSDAGAIARALHENPTPPAERPPIFGDGKASTRILDLLDAPSTRQIVARARERRVATSGAR